MKSGKHFINPNNILGSDGIYYTPDDGILLVPDNNDANQIGAYRFNR
jgi:hypothetical protein